MVQLTVRKVGNSLGVILPLEAARTLQVKEGDKVLYAKYAGTEFKIDGDEFLIVSQKDILAIVAD